MAGVMRCHWLKTAAPVSLQYTHNAWNCQLVMGHPNIRVSYYAIPLMLAMLVKELTNQLNDSQGLKNDYPDYT
jgi:hypothetical protein